MKTVHTEAVTFPQFRPFRDLAELIEHLKVSDYVFYHAPLDARPGILQVRQYTVSNVDITRSRATVWSQGTGQLALDLNEHLDRFRTREASL